MKKQITIEQSFCDVCGNKSSGYSQCISCGKDLCYDCKKTHAIEYAHAVHFQGSGDGLYCLDCDAKLLAANDKKHAAYLKIRQLRNEEMGWYNDFRVRVEQAEKALKALSE